MVELMTRTIRLPWPDRRLHPNARAHWATKARAAAAAREYSSWAAKIAGWKPQWPDVTVTLVFCPPDRRRRDIDGMLGAMKSALDGIADATGIDDSRWRIRMERGEPTNGGAVLVSMTGGAD